MTSRFHPEARIDFLEALEFYTEVSVKLGNQFTSEVERIVDHICEYPEAAQKIDDQVGVRRIVIHQFPFAIVYAVKTDVIIILAVMHTSRRPGYWKNRLD